MSMAVYRYPDGTPIDVDDIVEATERGDAGCCEGGPEVGERGCVTRILRASENSCGPIVVEFDNYGQWQTVPEKLVFIEVADGPEDEPEEEAEEEEEETTPAKFKVGDRVRLISYDGAGGASQDGGGPKIGDEGVIDVLENDDDMRVEFDRTPRFGGSWWLSASCIEPAYMPAESEEAMAEKTKAAVPTLMGTAPEIIRQGRTLILPDGMTNLEGIEWLKRREAEDKQMVAVRHEFAGVYPLDAMVALNRAFADIYNWVAAVPTPGFFGPTPPTMFTIKTGPKPGEMTTVPLGSFAIPGVRGKLQTAIGGPKKAQPSFFLLGEVAQGDMGQVKAIITKAEERLRTSSIYRGKAIKVSWEWARQGEDFNIERHSPQFLDLSTVNERDLVFSADVQGAIDDGLWTLLEHTEACRANGVPLKRGILLEGPPGTGKTLLALVAALKAVANGWTMVYADDVRDLPQALRLAEQYAKAVVFAEDLDRVISGERDSDMDEILNCLDGVDTKGQEIVTIVTTNAVDNIIKPALRPGRIDMILSTRQPDAKAAETLVLNYGRGLLDPAADLTDVGLMLQGRIPAVIREVVERSKMAAIRRLRSPQIAGKVLGADLVKAARAMEAHAKLLEDKEAKPVERTLRIPMTVVDKSLGLNGALSA